MARENDLQELYEKFLLGQSDAMEMRLLMDRFGVEDPTVLDALIHRQLEDEQAIAPEDAAYQEKYDRIFVNLRRGITPVQDKNIFNQESLQPDSPNQKGYKWLKIAAAASIAMAVGLGAYLFNTSQQTTSVEDTVKVQPDVGPGGNKAFLVLSNGQEISLASAKSGIIGIEAGGNIRKVANGEIVYEHGQDNEDTNTHTNSGTNTLKTPNGGQYSVRLPDGTKVWLNAASSIKYAANFNNVKLRKIELTGEAYFEVSKDPERPFIVQTDDQKIKVLGTHFNVNAYHDEGGSKTTLLEGSIKASAGTAGALVRPEQQVTSTGPNHLKVEDADTESALAWKNNQFMFESETIQQLMKRLARWYDVKVVYSDKLGKVNFNGAISKLENISAVLKILESTGKIHFRIDGRTVYVEK